MELTHAQQEKLHLLRLEALRRQLALAEARAALHAAEDKESTVLQHVLDNNVYLCDCPGDAHHGRRIDSPMIDFLMSEAASDDYILKIKAAFLSLFGIDNPLNFVYSWPFRQRLYAAERAYYLVEVDFLRVFGRPEADALETAIKGYLRPELQNRLERLVDSLLTGLPPAEQLLADIS